MGIDTEMLVRTRERSDKEIVRLSAYLHEAFPEFCWIDVKRGQHALSRVNVDQWYDYTPEFTPGPGEMLLRVNTLVRYYGPGYERGPAVQIIAVARWLEETLGGDTQVFYGSDSGGEPQLFGPEQREALWKHFRTYGRRPYTGAFGQDNLMQRLFSDGQPPPTCDFCDNLPMATFGGGGGEAFYSCHGCGQSWRVNNATGAKNPYRD